MKHLKYASYVFRHKWYVFLSALKYVKRLGWLLGPVLLFRAIIHDWSKFTPKEWNGYANFFYGYFPDEEERRQMFQILGHLHI